MRFLSSHLVLLGTASASRLFRRDQTISQNTLDTSPLGFLGFALTNTTINAGVTYEISGQSPHSIFGNLDNSGSLLINEDYAIDVLGIQTPLEVSYTSVGGDGNLVNRAGALISIDDFGALVGSAYTFALNSLSNSGTIQFCGRGDLVGSAYTLTAIQDLNNNAGGVIDFEQYYGNTSVSANTLGNIGVTGIDLNYNINNNGLIRLINVTLPLAQNALGTGCYGIGIGSVLSLEAGVFSVGTLLPSQALSGQSIYFSSTASGVLRLDAGAVTPVSVNTFSPLIYGFRANNFFEFTGLLFALQSAVYTSPYLTVSFGAIVAVNTLELNIGPGYTASGFFITTNNLNSAVGYRGTAGTRAAPAVCQLAAPFCADPRTSVSSAFATTITSATSTASTSATATTTDAYPSTTTGTPGTSGITSTLSGGSLCTCPSPSVSVFVTA